MWIFRIGIVLLLSAAIYPLIALTLIVTQSPEADPVAGAGMDFAAAMDADYASLPPLQTYQARDGARLPYRLYGTPDSAQRILVLVHGSGWHGMQFHDLAGALSAKNETLVLVPDLRGHGADPARRGDIDYIGQFEDDLADLIDHALTLAPDKPVILGGHSSGGGLAVRFAGGEHAGRVSAYILLAPFLQHDAPTTRLNSGGWAHPAVRRIIGLTMLNTVGITALNGLPVIAFAMPQAVLEGPYGATATTQYSFRLNTSFAPRADYRADLAAIDVPMLLIAGEDDEAFFAGLYEPTIACETPHGQYHIVDSANHIGVVSDADTIMIIESWLDRL